MDTTDLSIVVPTYGRDGVLVETLEQLLALDPPAGEILVVDQTPQHEAPVHDRLVAWSDEGKIRWLRLERPAIVPAMNRGLLEAAGDIVLFLDDDIVPSPDLAAGHLGAYVDRPGIWAACGQVLQPGQSVSRGPSAGAGASISLDEDLSFNFASSEPALVCNVMAGNLSVRRDRALQIGGFDENFIGVAYRFETEFARRVIAGGGKIQFQPAASMRHLRESRGGTRSHGDHRSSASPLHGVGDHYFALICGSAARARQHMLKRIIREVMTRYHLSRPWYIPIKLFGEIRACALAHRLYQSGPRLLSEAAQRDSSGEKH